MAPAAFNGPEIGANAPKNKAAGIAMAITFSAFAAFGGILYGYDTGVINGVQAMKDWLRTFGFPTTDLVNHPTGFMISTAEQSLVVSILSVGTFFGALLGAPTADILGRKWGIVFSTLIFCIGVAMQTASTALPLFVAGRVIAGIGVGEVSVLIPMYQSECAPKWIRGTVVSGYQWAITIGILLASVVNNATQDRDDHSSYRIPISIQFIWAAVLAGGMTILPESPRWLIMKGRDADAAHSLSRLTGAPLDDPTLTDDLSEMKISLEEERRLGSSTYRDCFRVGEPNKILFRIVTGMAIQMWQQLTGINFIFYYGTTFFMRSGITDAFLISVATNVVNVFMTIPGMWAVERFGRRRMLLIGATGMCVCEFIVAIAGVALPQSNLAGQKVLIAFVCIYIGFFASTWGPIAWVITGEIFPLNVRAKGMSLAVASNWLWNFAIGFATPFLVNSGPGNANLQAKVFFIWGSTCFCCIVFTYFCIPETKGLSLEQIDVLYMHSTPLTSHRVRAKLMAEDAHASDEKIVGEEIRTEDSRDDKV
ncbi:MFS monosaccharide transporter [Phellopilus nigrolimitatus]|nr:MFS monosaccharide transporter [Phellopilus nigrolimitatus]